MKEDLPEEWLPTRKTKGRDVPRSEFLASGPESVVLSGIMEEWSCVTCVIMDWCTSLLMASLFVSLGEMLLLLLLLLIPPLEVSGFFTSFDQFHVDKYRKLFLCLC